MTKTLLYIGTITNLIQLLNRNYSNHQKYICFSTESDKLGNPINYIDDIITQMKDNGFIMKLTQILYFSHFSIEFYNNTNIVYYHFNNSIYHMFYNILPKEDIDVAIIDRNFHLEEQFIENLTKRNIKIIFM